MNASTIYIVYGVFLQTKLSYANGAQIDAFIKKIGNIPMPSFILRIPTFGH